MAILRHPTSTAAFGDELGRYLAALRLGVVRDRVRQTMAIFEASGCSLSENTIQVLRDFVGNPNSDSAQLERVWSALLVKLRELRALAPSFAQITDACDAVAQRSAPPGRNSCAPFRQRPTLDPGRASRLAFGLGLGG